MTGAAVELDGVWKAYGGYVALADVSRSWAGGAVHAIVGANGAGKTTLCKVLYGAVRADAGAVAIGGERVDFHSPAQARRAGITVVHQAPTVVGALSAADNLFLGAEARVLRRERVAAAQRAFDELEVPLHAATTVDRLTQYERRLLEIARAAFARSRVVIFDEPTAGLGPRQREHVLDLVGRLRDAGTTVFYVSHNFGEVVRVCDTVTVLRDGVLVHSQDEASESSAELERLVFDLPSPPAGSAPPGAEPVSADGADAAGGEPALALAGWRLPGFEHRVELELGTGEIVGVFGLIDSGIDELAGTLTGLQRPEEGTLRTRAGEWGARRWSIRRARRAGIATLPADRAALGVLTGRTCYENVTASRPLLALGPVLERRRREDAHVAAALRPLETKASPRDAIEALSGGNQQKVVLARLIEARPAILLAHEPTVGVDVASRAAIRRRLRELAAEGMTILVLSSDWEEVDAVARRVLRIDAGRLTPQRHAPEEADVA